MQNLNMRPLKIIIRGDFYDSQLYSGRLFLWGNDGSIRIFDWDAMIDNISVPDRLKLALQCGFYRSDYLYGARWNMIFRDEEVSDVIINKFRDLAREELILTEEFMAIYQIRHQSNPMFFPHSESLIYNNEIYIGSRRGVEVSSCNKKNKNPVSLRPKKLWDCPTLGLSASYATLSVSAGSEGLFQIDREWNGRNYCDPQQVINVHSSSSRWLYGSIFSKSHVSGGVLAEFEVISDPRDRISERIYRETLLATSIFDERKSNGTNEISSQKTPKQKTYTWGMHDKLCQIEDRRIKIIKYSPWEDERFESLGEIQLRDFKGDVVSGDSALFGFVIECDNGLVVMDSMLNNIWLDGEPVCWKVFPRSKHYENQLHVVYDDRIEILSFNHDYFVDQKLKKVGIRKPNIGRLKS